MKQSAALLLAGLVLFSPCAGAQEPPPPSTADQPDFKQARPGMDYVTLNFSNIEI